MSNRYVTYLRVSTVRQGRSGLGLDAQKTMLASFLVAYPGEVLGEYTEIETGTSKKARPELAKAIDHARVAGATLVIAKLDRLARNVAFTSALLESKLPFKACDMPEADNFVIHILAALAEREAHLISERTSAALQELKKRGVKLGSARPGHWEGKEHLRGWKKAAQASREQVQEEMSKRYEPIVPWIKELRAAGATLQGVCDALNKKGCRTRRNKPWNPSTLRTVILKYLGPDYLGYPGSKVRPVKAMV